MGGGSFLIKKSLSSKLYEFRNIDDKPDKLIIFNHLTHPQSKRKFAFLFKKSSMTDFMYRYKMRKSYIDPKNSLNINVNTSSSQLGKFKIKSNPDKSYNIVADTKNIITIEQPTKIIKLTKTKLPAFQPILLFRPLDIDLLINRIIDSLGTAIDNEIKEAINLTFIMFKKYMLKKFKFTSQITPKNIDLKPLSVDTEFVKKMNNILITNQENNTDRKTARSRKQTDQTFSIKYSEDAKLGNVVVVEDITYFQQKNLKDLRKQIKTILNELVQTANILEPELVKYQALLNEFSTILNKFSTTLTPFKNNTFEQSFINRKKLLQETYSGISINPYIPLTFENLSSIARAFQNSLSAINYDVKNLDNCIDAIEKRVKFIPAK